VLRLRADVKEPDCENLVSVLGGIGGVRRVTATDEVANARPFTGCITLMVGR